MQRKVNAYGPIGSTRLAHMRLSFPSARLYQQADGLNWPLSFAVLLPDGGTNVDFVL